MIRNDCQNVYPKLPKMFLHRKCHLPNATLMPKSVTSFPQTSLSSLHILFNLIIDYFLCLDAIENPVMIG